MALNFPGPFQLRINYEVEPPGFLPLMHVMQFNVDVVGDPTPGTAFADVDVNLRVAGTSPLSTVSQEIVALVKVFFLSTDAIFTDAELWKVASGSFDMTYISTYALAIAGTGVAATIPGQNSIYTFRTFGGGGMKLYLMESESVPTVTEPYGGLTGDAQDLADYFIDDAFSPFVARDNTYPHICLNLLRGMNESTFKKRYRP